MTGHGEPSRTSGKQGGQKLCFFTVLRIQCLRLPRQAPRLRSLRSFENSPFERTSVFFSDWNYWNDWNVWNFWTELRLALGIDCLFFQVSVLV